jgi:hypothetical protein
MKKQLIIIGIIVLLIAVGLSGCNEVNQSNDKSKFIGTWYKSNDLVINLLSDGTCSYLEQSGAWDVKDGKLVLELSSGYNPSFNYAFSDSDLTLKLTSTLDGSTVVYTKRGP